MQAAGMPPAWPSAPFLAGLLCVKSHPSWLMQLPADLATLKTAQQRMAGVTGVDEGIDALHSCESG